MQLFETTAKTYTFNLGFLKMSPSQRTEELETVKLIKADILPEPFTTDKQIIVICWKSLFAQRACISLRMFPCLSRSGLLNDTTACEVKPRSDNSEKNSKATILRSSIEKLRRERIKHCCEQLQTLLPYKKGRKNDAASVLEATVDYMRSIQDKIPQAVASEVTLQSNKRFCKRYF
uniref:Spermatogenesis- and oogenesis-specific basic helix-loop-helix-containing protein 2 n=1 Tax=Sphenodon punctatus TaxID=8508 RepID=A0A8D0L7Y0_SPHPU